MKKKMKKQAYVFIIILVLACSFLVYLNSEYYFHLIRSRIIESAIEDTPGVASKDTYPLLLFHGFNFVNSKRVSEFSMKSMQNELSKDIGYVDKGVYTDELTCAELKYQKNPIIIRASYFDRIKPDDIDKYSEKIAEIIDRVRYCTGADKVDVITHSMGGVVVRNYIKNIDQESIRKFIMIATPNHGGLYNLGKFVDYLTELGVSGVELDFMQLSEKTEFMKALNLGDETIGDIEYYTVAGNFDGIGDGIVRVESVTLNGSNQEIIVDCNHVLIKHPSFCPEAYVFVRDSLY